MGKSRRQYPRPADIEAFAGEADQSAAAPAKPAVVGDELPWRQPHVRQDVKSQLLLRIPEDYKLALGWLAHQHQESQQAYVLRVLEEALDADAEAITGRPVRDV